MNLMNLQKYSKELLETVSFYNRLMEMVKRENLNPFEISLYQVKQLISDNITYNGMIILILARLVNMKANYILEKISNPEKEDQIKSIFKQVIKDETQMNDEDIELLLTVESIRYKLRKPKTVNPEKITYKEFQELAKNQVIESISNSIDYNKYAEEIAKQIKEGTFKIKSYRDFIGLMFAIYIFNIEVKDIKDFL